MGDLALAQNLGARGIADARVLEAIASLCRADFMPEDVKAEAHADAPSPIGFGQTISQPYIVAFMTQALQLRPGMRVLEVGTGSGYQAAVLARMGVDVFSVERLAPLAAQARRVLERLGLPVQVKVDDGSRGWPEEAPFDRILVTAACARAPHRLIEQLKLPGRLVAPVGEQQSSQHLIVVDRAADGALHWSTLLAVRFVPLIEDAHPPSA